MSDGAPGLTRWRCGRGFTYVRADGHIQASGYDARGRKQYRYHAEWRRVRDENKFARLHRFARALPKLRRRVRRDLVATGLDRNKVIAALGRLLARIVRSCQELPGQELFQYVDANGTVQPIGSADVICRRCYIHPLVVEAYESGAGLPGASGAGGGRRLTERAVLGFLTSARQGARRAARQTRKAG